MKRGEESGPLEEGISLASQIALELLRQMASAVEDPLGDRSLKTMKEYAGTVKSLQDTLGAGVEYLQKLTEDQDGEPIRVILGEAEEYAN